MIHLPRIAVGTVQRDATVQIMAWALMNVLEQAGLHVQSFSSQSRFGTGDASVPITGQNRRHLDSWLMSSEVCAELLVRGTQFSDIGIVDGQFDVARVCSRLGGSLDTLCQWLDLPQLVTINVGLLEPFQWPVLPKGADGLLLDNVSDAAQFCRVRTELEAMYGIPVLGVMDRIGSLRAVVAELPPSESPTPDLCRALGDALAPHLDLERLLQIAARRGFKEVENKLFQRRNLARPLHIAVAFDDAFRCYFPGTLDVLLAQGASLSVFSPLRSDRLPSNTDLVYFGCGRPEDYMNELAANFCLKEALWNHVASGRRIYAESAGLAYLCHEIVMPCGNRWPMVGLLPVLARVNPMPIVDRPVEFTMARESWLFAANETVRGYLNSRWIIHPDGALAPMVSEAEHSHNIIGDYQIVGSRLHLNFAASQRPLGKFFEPCIRSPLDPVI